MRTAQSAIRSGRPATRSRMRRGGRRRSISTTRGNGRDARSSGWPVMVMVRRPAMAGRCRGARAERACAVGIARILFLGLTGLADGLALKELRYANGRDSPHDCGSPASRRVAETQRTAGRIVPAFESPAIRRNYGNPVGRITRRARDAPARGRSARPSTRVVGRYFCPATRETKEATSLASWPLTSWAGIVPAPRTRPLISAS